MDYKMKVTIEKASEDWSGVLEYCANNIIKDSYYEVKTAITNNTTGITYLLFNPYQFDYMDYYPSGIYLPYIYQYASSYGVVFTGSVGNYTDADFSAKKYYSSGFFDIFNDQTTGALQDLTCHYSDKNIVYSSDNSKLWYDASNNATKEGEIIEQEDNIYFTDFIPSILNGYVNKSKLLPLNSSLAGGIVFYDENIEKKRDNIDTDKNSFFMKSLDSNIVEFSGASGHVGSICLTTKDYVNNPDMITDYTIPEYIQMEKVINFNGEKNELITMTYDDFDYATGGVTFILRKLKEPKFGLHGYNYKNLTENSLDDITLYKSTCFVPRTEYNKYYYYNLPSFDVEEEMYESDIENDEGEKIQCKCYNILIPLTQYSSAGGQYSYNYGQDNKNIYMINYFKYIILRVGEIGYQSNNQNNSNYNTEVVYPPNCQVYKKIHDNNKYITNGTDIEISSKYVLITIRKDYLGSSSEEFENIEGDVKNINISSGMVFNDEKAISDYINNNYVINPEVRFGAADDNYIYIVVSQYNSIEDKKIYYIRKEKIDKMTYYKDYDKNILYNIGRKNSIYQNCWNCWDASKTYNIGRKKGINNIFGIFTPGISGIANFDLDIEKGDKVKIEIILTNE